MANALIATPLVPICYETHICNQRSYLMSGSDLGGTSRAWFNVIAAANQVRFLFTNFYNGGSGETNQPSAPGAITVSASMEDPNNSGTVLYQLTFNGASSASIALNGFLWSDPVDYDFTAGQVIWLRTYLQGTSGQYFPNNSLMSTQNNYPTGYGYTTSDASTVGNNYATDGGSGTGQLTTSGTSWLNGAHNNFAKCYTATAIIGKRVAAAVPIPIVAVIGDSIAEGLLDTSNAELGFIMRACRASGMATLQLASPSEFMSTIGSGQPNYRVRRSLVQFATHAVVEYGVNDIFSASVSLATLKTYAQAAYQLLVNRGLNVYATTLGPNTTGTYTSASGQATKTGESVRTAWNTYLRTWPQSGDLLLNLLSGVFDTAATIEVNASNALTPNGGFWYCGPSNNTAYTADGLHPYPNGNVLMQAAIPASSAFVVATYGPSQIIF